MKKLIYLSILFLLTACHGVNLDAHEEAVLIKKPWFFGHGGIDDTPISSGLTWCAITTHAEYFTITPVRYDESFNDIFSNDNTPLDFNSYINIQIISGKTPILLKNYGKDWYKNNIQVPYRNFTREEVSKYSPFDLISNREILNDIDKNIMNKMLVHLETLSKNKEFPIIIQSITTGAASPNSDQLTEMNKTAAAIQAVKTQERNKELEIVRAEAEKARARADKAYMQEMNLSANQFIQLQYIKLIEAKKDANIDVLIGGEQTSMWNIRR